MLVLGAGVTAFALVFWGVCWPVALYCHVVRGRGGYVSYMCSVGRAAQ